jgi:SlyX protein
MTTPAELAARLDRLEETVAFQDQTIEDLHKVIADQWREIDGLKRQLGVLGDQLREVEAGLPNRPEPPPPHY